MPNIVYALSNPAMPGLVKIGMTDRDHVQQRMHELFTTGVPFPFECVIAKEIEDHEAGHVENALHTAFRPYRANESREFFQIDPEQVEVLLQVIRGNDVTPRVSRELAAVSSEDSEAAAEFKKRQAKTNEEEFLASFFGNGRAVYESVLALGKRQGMLVNWGVSGFSLNVVWDGVRVVVCYGHPPFAYYGRMYTDFAIATRKANVPQEEIEALRRKGLDTGLFVPVGKRNDISCHTDRTLDESQVAAITGWLWDMVELVRKYANSKQDER